MRKRQNKVNDWCLMGSSKSVQSNSLPIRQTKGEAEQRFMWFEGYSQPYAAPVLSGGDFEWLKHLPWRIRLGFCWQMLFGRRQYSLEEIEAMPQNDAGKPRPTSSSGTSQSTNISQSGTSQSTSQSSSQNSVTVQPPPTIGIGQTEDRQIEFKRIAKDVVLIKSGDMDWFRHLTRHIRFGFSRNILFGSRELSLKQIDAKEW